MLCVRVFPGEEKMHVPELVPQVVPAQGLLVAAVDRRPPRDRLQHQQM
jgi:hypothetical protein